MIKVLKKKDVVAEEVKEDFGKKNRNIGRAEGAGFVAALVIIIRLLKL